MERLIGKVAAITGGAAGIGEAHRALALSFGRQKRTCGRRSKIWRRRGPSPSSGRRASSAGARETSVVRRTPRGSARETTRWSAESRTASCRVPVRVSSAPSWLGASLLSRSPPTTGLPSLHWDQRNLEARIPADHPHLERVIKGPANQHSVDVVYRSYGAFVERGPTCSTTATTARE